MSEIATVILPFFGLIAFGFGATRLMRLPAQGVSGLNLFVYYFAMPALVLPVRRHDAVPRYRALVVPDRDDVRHLLRLRHRLLVRRAAQPRQRARGDHRRPRRLLCQYRLHGAGADGRRLRPGGRRRRRRWSSPSITRMLFTIVPLMMALGGTARTNGSTMGRDILRRVFLHPFIMAAFAGLLVSAVGVGMPGPINGMLVFLQFGGGRRSRSSRVGASLAQKHVGRVTIEMPGLLIVKLVAPPADRLPAAQLDRRLRSDLGLCGGADGGAAAGRQRPRARPEIRDLSRPVGRPRSCSARPLRWSR